MGRIRVLFFITSVVIPLTVAFICTTRQSVIRILVHGPQQQQLPRAAAIRKRSLFVHETTDTSITAATTATTIKGKPLKKKEKKTSTFSSMNTTKKPVVVKEQERLHSIGEEEDDDDGDGDHAILSTTSTLRQKRSSKSSPFPLPVFRVVPARPMVSAVNSTSIVFTVYGEPVPLSRHMVARGRMYNPSAKLQKEFAAACVDHLPLVPLAGPLEATLLFYFKRPKNQYGTGKNANILKPAVVAAGLWHSKRKDLDNLVKFVLDSLNGKAYEDDAQIAAITCAKFYTEDDCGRTEVIIKSLIGLETITKKYESSGGGEETTYEPYHTSKKEG